MFAVDDIDDTVARLRAHVAELLGEVAQCESIFRLCYLRGPAGIIVASGRTDRLTLRVASNHHCGSLPPAGGQF